jgi:hypothetical protein
MYVEIAAIVNPVRADMLIKCCLIGHYRNLLVANYDMLFFLPQSGCVFDRVHFVLL